MGIDFARWRRFSELNQLRFSVALGSYTCDILGWGCLGERWWRNYLHRHSFYEICCAFAGAGVFRINGVDYAVQTGDVFVAKPTELHEIVSSEAEPLGICFWSYTLLPHVVRATHAIDDEMQQLDQLLHGFVRSTCWVSQRNSPSLLSTCQLLADEIATRAPGYRQNVEGLTAKLIIDTARAVVPPLPKLRSDLLEVDQTPHQQTLKLIIQYLRDNYTRSITIRDIAAQVHLSERHVSRLFQQSVGRTIKDYVMTLRMDTASKYLLGNDRPIKEVGEAVGIPDVQHFTTVFKRHTGLTPATFRRQRGTRFSDPDGPRHIG